MGPESTTLDRQSPARYWQIFGRIDPEKWPVDTLIIICGRHPHSGRLGVIARYEEIRDARSLGELPVVLLNDGRDCMVYSARQMKKVNV